MERRLGIVVGHLAVLWSLLVICAGPSLAESAHRDGLAVGVLMISDIHFEPFWDPGKVSDLAAAPVSQWKTILAGPDSGDREQRFQDLDVRSLNNYAIVVSSILYFQWKITGAALVS
jgi:hypothetical protein